MNENNIQPLRTVYHRKLAETTLGFKRYLYGQINWDVRMLGIKGEKGVGKTTLILQHILETFDNPDDALYVSMDNMWFTTHSIFDLADYLYSMGVYHLFLDEIHICMTIIRISTSFTPARQCCGLTTQRWIFQEDRHCTDCTICHLGNILNMRGLLLSRHIRWRNCCKGT